MALKDQINTVAGGAAALIGSGRKGTPIDPENIKHLYLMPIDQKFTETINRAKIRSLQKAGLLIPLLDVFDCTFAPEENQRRTAPNSGVTKKTRAGLYSLTAIFDSGIYFQKVLESMEGSNRWRVIVIDDEDQWFGTTGKNDEFKGWQVANFEVNPYQFKQGTEGGTTSVYMQLGRSSEINKDIAYLTPEAIPDFLPGDMEGPNQVRLDLGPLVAASTTFTVKAVIDKDNSTFVAGLLPANFLVKKSTGETVEVTGAVANAETKEYTLTVAALVLEEKLSVKLYDSVNNSPVIEVGAAPDEILYQSKESTGVVVAA